MSWTPRQVSMLEAMGLRLWTRPVGDQPVHRPSRASSSAAALRARPAQRINDEGLDPRSANPGAAQAGARPDPARELAGVATMDWPALREAVSQCRACGLCQSRTQTVFGVGHQRAHWMVVGEAPGEQEDLLGEPFVGTAGRLLDNMLRAMALSRHEAPPERSVYIANTLKCRPPRNRNPAPEELLRCEPFLLRQIELVQPRIILAMGRFAVQSLLRSDEPIGRLRGRVHQYHGVPLIVTYHPAYLLRNLTDKARAWEDLCLAMDTMQTLAVKAP